MMSEFAGMSEMLDDGTWRPIDQDPALAVGVVRAQRELLEEASRARTRARLEQVDEQADEDTSNRSHLADRLQAADDDFTRQMLAAAREDTE